MTIPENNMTPDDESKNINCEKKVTNGISRWRKVSRGFVIISLCILLLGRAATGVLSLVVLDSVGKLPDAAVYRDYEKLPNFKDGKFINHEPMQHIIWKKPRKKIITRFLTDPPKAPLSQIPRKALDGKNIGAKSEDLRVFWLGHSTLIFDINGTRIMTDPIFGNAAPLPKIVKRFQPSPLRRSEIPKLDLDAILISHDHYDHLEKKTIQSLVKSDICFIVPLGVGARLRGWGIAADRITELNWGQSVEVGKLKITSVTSRHFSGRLLKDRNRTLWSAFVLTGLKHNVFFAGDGGYGSHFKDIGAKYGPFDLTCLEIGAWCERWPNSHLFPEQTIQAHKELRGKYLLPIHWGAYDLAFHEWDEPIQRATAAAVKEKVELLTPIQGEGVIPGRTATTNWWLPVSGKFADDSK